MMTLKRFGVLTASYGADLRIWPGDARQDAEQLLIRSPEAQAILAEAAALDRMIATVTDADETEIREAVDAAALARLRSGVDGRVAALNRTRRTTGKALVDSGRHWAFAAHLRWLGMATSGGVAVVAGLIVGALYVSSPAAPQDPVMSMLQPASMQLLGE